MSKLLQTQKVSQVRLNRIAKFQSDKLKEFREVWNYKPCDKAEFDSKIINSCQTLIGDLYNAQNTSDIELLVCNLIGINNAYNQFTTNKF
jgi:succinyl-CoA synthetase beta subunit